jgi:hypothetical protein
LITTTSFVQAASSNGYTPQYFATDWQSQTATLAVENMPPTFSALATTTSRIDEYMMGATPPPTDEACVQTYNKASGSNMTSSDSNWEAVMIDCGLISLFTNSAASVGANLTRPRLAAALESLGPINFPFFGGGSLRSGKYDIGDLVRTLKFEYSCKCWVPIDKFVPPQY